MSSYQIRKRRKRKRKIWRRKKVKMSCLVNKKKIKIQLI
jgi:hypothetical protein